MMQTLAIECATDVCSLALFADDALLAAHHEVLGRGHAERIVPLIAALPDRGQAERILVSLGPGSFTGVRIGLATARALGVAWGAEVLGYPTLALLIATARARMADGPGPAMAACMAGGHGEWFVQPFDAQGHATGPAGSLPPETAVQAYNETWVVGSRAEDFVALRGFGEALAILPDAACAPFLPRDAFTADLAPIYGRGPDARLPG